MTRQADVMDPEDAGAAAEPRHAGADRTRVPLSGGDAPQERPDERLAGSAEHEWAAELGKLRQTADELQILRGRLGEADAGVEHYGVVGDPGGPGAVQRRGQLSAD